MHQQNTIYVDVKINNEHIQILTNALQINNAKFNCRIRELFSYYTSNEEALIIADDITVILKDVPEDKKIKYNNQEENLLAKI